MHYKNYIAFDSKYLFSRRFLVVLLLFFLLGGYFVQRGLDQYFNIMGEKDNFQRFEKQKLKQFVYLSQYGDYGLRLFFAPSPFMAFFDGGPVPNIMTAFIDTSERMEIFQPLKSQNAFDKFNNYFMNFAGFILLCGGALALFYGYDASRWHDWLKFLEGKFKNQNKLYVYLIATRAIILFLICMLLGIQSLIVFIINGVSIKVSQVLAYSLSFFVMLLCFLIIGFCGGAAKSRFKGGTAVIVAWFLLTVITPMLICSWTFIRAADIESTYNMEEKKLKKFMNYERTSFEEAGKFDASKRGSQKEKDMFMAFWNSGFKLIMEDEQKLLNETKNHINFYQTLAGLFPSTFFLSLSGEMSSRGFSSMIDFNEYAQDVKKDFFWFRAENYIFSDKKTFQPFFKGDENIYQGKSQLPANFSFGIMVIVLWLAVLIGLSRINFIRMLKRMKTTKRELNLEDLKKDQTNIIFTSDKGLLPQLIAKLRAKNIQYASIPSPANLPANIKVKNLFTLFDLAIPQTLSESIADQYIYNLDPDQRGKVLIEITQSLNADVFLFENFLSGLSDEIIHHFSLVLSSLKKGRSIVYFTNSLIVTTLICDCGIKWNDEKIAF